MSVTCCMRMARGEGRAILVSKARAAHRNLWHSFCRSSVKAEAVSRGPWTVTTMARG